MTADELKAEVEKEREGRAKRCAEKLQALLSEENCEIDVAVLVTSQGNLPQLTIRAK